MKGETNKNLKKTAPKTRAIAFISNLSRSHPGLPQDTWCGCSHEPLLNETSPPTPNNPCSRSRAPLGCRAPSTNSSSIPNLGLTQHYFSFSFPPHLRNSLVC